ncbi:MAG: D-alanine--D-alanine ligase [Pirellulales bacterium]|nr:D-alanine--D-alanine ligase [Pirellulales bacterium]
MSSRLRVAVLAGGESAEREISLASGLQVAAALDAAGHAVELVDPIETPLESLVGQFDVCFVALHGGAGEDGRVQRRLDALGLPYTGSGPDASQRAMSKSLAKAAFHDAGVPTPEAFLVDLVLETKGLADRARRLGFPLIVKPDDQGSSVGLGVATDEEDLVRKVAEAGRYGRIVLVERFVRGRELTVTVLGRRALAPLEIVGRPGVFDFDSKYTSDTIEYHFQTGLLPKKTREVQEVAVAAAEALGTSGMVRVDLILDDSLRPWVLEVNTVPGMTDHSLCPMAAREAGWGLAALCDWALRDALDREVVRPA